MILSLGQEWASHSAFCEWAQEPGQDVCSSGLNRMPIHSPFQFIVYSISCIESYHVRHSTRYNGHRDAPGDERQSLPSRSLHSDWEESL